MITQKSETMLFTFLVFLHCPATQGKEIRHDKKGFAVTVFDSINFQLIFV